MSLEVIYWHFSILPLSYENAQKLTTLLKAHYECLFKQSHCIYFQPRGRQIGTDKNLQRAANNNIPRYFTEVSPIGTSLERNKTAFLEKEEIARLGYIENTFDLFYMKE